MLAKTPFQKYVFSKSAAERIFKAEVKELEVYQKSIRITFKKGQGMRPTFASKKVFLKHFSEYRQESARLTSVTYHPLTGNFSALCSHNIQERYQISLYPDCITCNCGDWQKQEEIGIKTPMCKHAYATLHYIGCTDLEDYIKRDGFSFLNHNTYMGDDADMRAYYEEQFSEEHYLW